MVQESDSKLQCSVLNDVTVVDFSVNAAGPNCAMMLADFGANVIKVEPPSGDATRHWGISRYGDERQFTATFLAMNRNKAGVVLDLKQQEGRDAAYALIRQADVVLSSFLPDVAQRLGVDYASAARINSQVIHCSITGFGGTGPMRDRPAFDMLMQACAGHMSITGEPGQPSVRIGPSSIDFLTGANAAFGIMLALRHRERSGHGQAIDISLYDTAVHLMTSHIGEYTGSGRIAGKFGSQFPMMAPYGIFQASDAEFYLGVSSDEMWQRFCAVIGRPGLASDQRFASNAGRLSERTALYDLLLPLLRQEPARHWVDLALELRIPASLVENVAGVVANEQTAARELLVDTGIGGVKTAGIPLKLSRTPGRVLRSAPRLGEDNERIFTALHLAGQGGLR